MAKSKYDGFGTKNEVSVDDGTTWESVGCIRDVIEFGAEVESFDVTCHNQGDDYRHYAPGLTNPQELTFTVMRDPGSTEDMFIYANLFGQEAKYRITYPSGATDEFNGFLKSRNPQIPMGDGPMIDALTIQISGPIITTPAPAP